MAKIALHSLLWYFLFLISSQIWKYKIFPKFIFIVQNFIEIVNFTEHMMLGLHLPMLHWLDR